MSYLATGADAGYRLDAGGRCVNAMNQAVDASLCRPSGSIMGAIYDALTKPAPIKASDIPVPKSTVTSVKFSGATSSDPWRVVQGTAKPTVKAAAIASSSGMPGWVMPVAISVGVLTLAVVLMGRKR